MEGDVEERFEQVFRRAYPRLVSLAQRVLRDRSAAEDVSQETLARLAGAAILDRPDSEIDAWLTRVCLNQTSNTLRTRTRSIDREDRAGRQQPRHNDDDDPAGALIAQEDRDSVRDALAALPDRQRAVLLLRHSGYTYAEIAAAMQISPGSTGTLLARAERAFRNIYAFDQSKQQETMQ